MAANEAMHVIKTVSERMHVYLNYFGMAEICNKLQTAGLTNLDAISHDWYQSQTEDEELNRRKLGYK